MYIVDRQGSIAYSQVGFHPSDVDRWKTVLADLTAGRAASVSGPERSELVVGERFPPIHLSLVDGKTDRPIDLLVEGAGFSLDSLRRFQHRGPSVLAHMYRGIATPSP